MTSTALSAASAVPYETLPHIARHCPPPEARKLRSLTEHLPEPSEQKISSTSGAETCPKLIESIFVTLVSWGADPQLAFKWDPKSPTLFDHALMHGYLNVARAIVSATAGTQRDYYDPGDIWHLGGHRKAEAVNGVNPHKISDLTLLRGVERRRADMLKILLDAGIRSLPGATVALRRIMNPERNWEDKAVVAEALAKIPVLIRAGADTASPIEGRLPVLWALVKRQPKIAEILFAAQPFTSKDASSHRALFKAIANSDGQELTALVSAGVDINIFNGAPLFLAAALGDACITAQLLKAGAQHWAGLLLDIHDQKTVVEIDATIRRILLRRKVEDMLGGSRRPEMVSIDNGRNCLICKGCDCTQPFRDYGEVQPALAAGWERIV
ncbi:hypothetical protein HK104_011244 [Borealophlyctis nickersoniae]|nr:hypothetical protein HK104_011244 [Borealophlyctis nickersoniae]